VTQVRPKLPKKPERSPRLARLVLVFDSRALRDEFRGWLSDGGGEQAFTADLEYFGDTTRRLVEVDYDGDIVRFKSKDSAKSSAPDGGGEARCPRLHG
jgi:hypothetical protein